MWRTSTETGSRLPSIHKKATVTAMAALLLLAPGANAQQKSAKTAQQTRRPERRIVVSIPDRKLALLEDGRVMKIYSVAVGAADTPTPSGEFRITTRLENPTWYWPHLVVPPGKDNPLGTRWMGLGKAGFGIHGTNAPTSIGKAASHGCIRIGRRDVEELFAKMRVGDAVEFHGESSAELAQIFGGQLQASATRGDALQVAALTSVSADRAGN